MRVKVYFNLHKKLFSVVAMEGENKGRVIEHIDKINLENCSFRVQKSGREKVLREKRKNVHAYISGYKVSSDNKRLQSEATYNPYKYSTFVDKNSFLPVFNKEYCSLFVEGQSAKILTSIN